MIPTEAGDGSKRPPTPPVPEGADDETFEDRLRHAIVRHFQFSWSELAQSRRAERQRADSEKSEPAVADASARTLAEPDTGSTTPPPPPGASVDATPPPTPGGNGAGPPSDEVGPPLPLDRPTF